MKTQPAAKHTPGDIYRDHFSPKMGTWRIMTKRGPWPVMFRTKREALRMLDEIGKRCPGEVMR